MSRIFDVTISEGSKVGEFTIYYDQINPSNIATISSSNTPAEDLSFDDLTTGNGVRVIVPNNVTEIILHDENGTCNDLSRRQAPLSDTGSFCFTSTQYEDGLLGFDSSQNTQNSPSVCQRYTIMTGDLQGDPSAQFSYINCNGESTTRFVTPNEEFTLCASDATSDVLNFTITDSVPCDQSSIYSNQILPSPLNTKIINIGGVDSQVIYDETNDTQLFLYKALTKSPIKYKLTPSITSPIFSNSANIGTVITSINNEFQNFNNSGVFTTLTVPPGDNVWVRFKITIPSGITTDNLNFTRATIIVQPLTGGSIVEGQTITTADATPSSGDVWIDAVKLTTGDYRIGVIGGQRHGNCTTNCSSTTSTIQAYYTYSSNNVNNFQLIFDSDTTSEFYYTQNGVDKYNQLPLSGNPIEVCADSDSVSATNGLVSEIGTLCTQYEQIHKLVFYAEGDKIGTNPTAEIGIIRNDLTNPNNIVISQSGVTSTSLSGGRLIEYTLTDSIAASMGNGKSICINYKI